MPNFIVHICTICGREKTRPGWFLLAENGWEDKLRVFQWDDRLAVRSGVHEVCSPAHVRELAQHWMSTGSLSYPYARNEVMASCNFDVFFCGNFAGAKSFVDATVERELGALSVHRESISRLLSENPRSLNAILDELVSALCPEIETKKGVAAASVQNGLATREA